MKTIMQTAFDYIDESDCYLQIIKSNEKSEGMLIETGYALAKNKKIISFIKKGVKTTWIKHLIENTTEYENTNDLFSKLKSIK
jgi:nucleoside 2-deoxyribosyltransferase